MTPHQGSPTLLQQLVRRTAAPVLAPDRERAARHLLDWAACALAASGLEPARAMRATLISEDPPEHLWTMSDQTDALGAVLADGALGSLLEMDDVHRAAVLHPGPVVIPAALATARELGVDTASLLDGIVRGYEVMIRLGRSLGLGHYRYWHPSSTCGAFGAAMAAASIRGLDETRTTWALANAGTRTGGLWQMRHEPVPSKALHTALAAQTGYLAAALADQGFSGPVSLLEGEQGLFAAMAPEADPTELIGESRHWLIHEVSFKPWPACRHAHPAMDALMAIEPRPAARDIDHIEVASYPAALDFCDCLHPTTPGQARFSIQHALASILVHGRPRIRHYEPEALDHPEVAHLRARIQLRSDEGFARRFPAHFGAAVRLRTRTGDAFEARVADAWGDPEWPLQDHDLAAKAADLLDYAGLEQDAAQRLIEGTLKLAAAPEQAAIAALRKIWT